MNTEIPPPNPLDLPVPLLSPAQLAAPGDAVEAWLWHGYLGPGMITAFTSQGKSGKTTLASILLARLAQGGELAGLPSAPTRRRVAKNTVHLSLKYPSHAHHLGCVLAVRQVLP